MSTAEERQAQVVNVEVWPEHGWRDVWHTNCQPRTSPFIHLREFMECDGYKLRRFRCAGCAVEVFAGLNKSNRITVVNV